MIGHSSSYEMMIILPVSGGHVTHLGVLQALQGSHRLGPDLRHLVLQPLQHPVVDLVVEVIINTGLFSHVLQDLVEELADPQPRVRALHLVVVQEPGEQSVEEQRELLLLLTAWVLLPFLLFLLQEAAGKLGHEF